MIGTFYFGTLLCARSIWFSQYLLSLLYELSLWFLESSWCHWSIWNLHQQDVVFLWPNTSRMLMRMSFFLHLNWWHYSFGGLFWCDTLSICYVPCSFAYIIFRDCYITLPLKNSYQFGELFALWGLVVWLSFWSGLLCDNRCTRSWFMLRLLWIEKYYSSMVVNSIC